MRSFSTTVLAYLASRTGVKSRSLLWIEGRDRTTGALAAMGFWSGDDHETFSIDGTPRLYYGAGTVVGLDALQFQTGLDVRMQRVTLAPTAPEVATALRGYDPRFARVELHRALFEPVGGALIEDPHRVWVGTLDQSPLPVPALGGKAGVELSLASATRWLTKSVPIKKSDEALKQRNTADDFRQYADYAGEVRVYWGEGTQRLEVVKPVETTNPNTPQQGDR